MILEGRAKLLRLYFGENDKWHGAPLYKAASKNAVWTMPARLCIAGVEGYGASTLIHRAHLLSVSSDAPIMVSVVDSEEKIRKLIPVLDEMVDEGLIAMSDVEVIKYVHQDGKRSQ